METAFITDICESVVPEYSVWTASPTPRLDLARPPVTASKSLRLAGL
jgi:hypothetical protein